MTLHSYTLRYSLLCDSRIASNLWPLRSLPSGEMEVGVVDVYSFRSGK